MEKQTETKQELTKEGKVTITTREAVEYREYKRQKKRAEILAAIANSEGVLGELEDARRVSDRAVRLRQAAVRMTPERLEQVKDVFVRSAMPVDCTVGGNGETLAKVKAYETRVAMRLHAKEITLMLSPYAVANCRYAEIKKELRRVRRVSMRAVLKVQVDKAYPATTLTRVARLCSEVGAQYFCVPYFDGCERLRMDLTGGCKLQVSDVETLEDFKKLVNAGVGRVVTEKGWEFYSEWMREVEKINFPELLPQKREEKPVEVKKDEEKPAEKKEEKPTVSGLPAVPVSITAALKAVAEKEENKKNEETDYCCRLEGKSLKFS